MKFIKIFLIFIIFALLINTGFGFQEKNFDSQSAGNLLKEYIEAVKSGNRSLVQEFWSDESIYQKGFWESMHITIGYMSSFDQFRFFLEYYQPEFHGLRNEADLYIIDFSWMPKDKINDYGHSMNMHYYVIKENDTYKLINPLDALTRSWKVYESRNFVLHYKTKLNLDHFNDLINELDQQYDEIAADMDINRKGKVNYYVASNEEFCGELLLLNPCNYYTSMARNLVVSTKFNLKPELVDKE
jgi:hypothetical protein